MKVKYRSWAALTLVVIAATFVLLGMTSPRVVPRLGFLPAPPSKLVTDGCEVWERRGIVWRPLYFGPREAVSSC